jgi:serine/threonine protein phosphatase PrpC
MATYVLRVGAHTAQGVRSNNEDRLVVDRTNNVFLVADGMGGQEKGEHAGRAVQRALIEANQAIIHAGRNQPAGRRMGTTAVLAVQQANQVYVAGLGDSRAYLIRDNRVEQLTVDHSVAQALVASGVLSAEEARHSPWQHVLHKFLGCAEMVDGADVRPFTPEAGDRLLLATDGLTNHVSDDDLRQGAKQFADPQTWAEHLVQVALERGSKDNVTCIVVAFDPE